jgi:hypothetical protein
VTNLLGALQHAYIGSTLRCYIFPQHSNDTGSGSEALLGLIIHERSRTPGLRGGIVRFERTCRVWLIECVGKPRGYESKATMLRTMSFFVWRLFERLIHIGVAVQTKGGGRKRKQR